MQEPLPTILIPLLASDADVPLDLSEAIQQVYQEADYDLTIDNRPHRPSLKPNGNSCTISGNSAVSALQHFSGTSEPIHS